MLVGLAGWTIGAVGIFVCWAAVIAAWFHAEAMEAVRAEGGSSAGVLRVTSVISAAVIALVLWIGMLMIRAGLLWGIYA